MTPTLTNSNKPESPRRGLTVIAASVHARLMRIFEVQKPHDLVHDLGLGHPSRSYQHAQYL